MLHFAGHSQEPTLQGRNTLVTLNLLCHGGSTPLRFIPLTELEGHNYGLKRQRSLRSSNAKPAESVPKPPNSQRLPLLSIHEEEYARALGTFDEEASPLVPYT